MVERFVLTVTTDDAPVSFQDVSAFDSRRWERMPPGIRGELAWPVEDNTYFGSATLITREMGGAPADVRLRWGAPSVVTARSALSVGRGIIFVTGSDAARLDVAAWRIAWRVNVDWATAFAVYRDPDDAAAVIIHGELTITKIALDGVIIWSMGGADFFVQPDRAPDKPPVVFTPGALSVTDWNGWVSTIDTATGQVAVERPDAGAADTQG